MGIKWNIEENGGRRGAEGRGRDHPDKGSYLRQLLFIDPSGRKGVRKSEANKRQEKEVGGATVSTRCPL